MRLERDILSSRFQGGLKLFAGFLCLSTTALAHGDEVPTPRIHGASGDSTHTVQWTPRDVVLTPSKKPGISFKTLVGDTREPGVYVVLVKLNPGAINAPHVHPDARVTTVISGTAFYGTGSIADKRTATAFGPGSVYFTPPNSPHWIFAGKEPVIYEEVGFGPSYSTPVSRP
jgi:quercetin dioxygenase-like cupin family protein